MNTNTIARLQAELADRFVIDRELGRGGMGVVYQARDMALGRQVAIKLLDSVVAERMGGGASFRREIKFTARLQHPHILPLLETGEVDGQAYYVMPYVKGGSLRAQLKATPQLRVEDALRVTREIGAALETAHQNNIVHCDLKPENILMSNGFAVLADFGIARSMLRDGMGWRKTDYGSLGSPVYISPEQASGERDLDQRSDVYSLACVLYEMLAGVAPFNGESVEAVVAQRFTETPKLVSELRKEVPVAVARAVARAMELDPRDRYPSMSAFVHALDAATAVQPLRARRPARGLLEVLGGLLNLPSKNHPGMAH